MKANQAKEFEKNDYGVFLNADASSLERFKMYETIVIDAQYFTKRDIELLHQNGTVVYTYLNIGSIENFREYYTTYAELAIGEYEQTTGIYCAISQRNISRKQRNAISGQHRTACLWIKDHTSVHTVKIHRIYLWQPDLENGG